MEITFGNLGFTVSNPDWGALAATDQYEIAAATTPLSLPAPQSKDSSKYAFTGWKITITKNGAATSVTDVDIKCNPDGSLPSGANTLATLQKADGTPLNAGSLFNASNIYEYMYTFEAQFAEGFPLVWDVETFGGSTASDFTFSSIGGGNSTTSNAVSGTTNRNELVAIVSGTATPAYGVMQFPDVSHKKDANVSSDSDGMRFLGWTTNSDGSPMNGTYYSYDGGKKYNVYSDKITDSSGTVIYSGSTVNLKWYAVWESQIDFEATSYGGKIDGGASADRTNKIWVKNNRPIANSVDTPKNVTDVDGTSKPTTGTFVPETASTTGWTFKGWVPDLPNPNGPSGGTTERATSLTGFVPVGTNLTPNGATTYYGVWECNVSWAAQTGVSGVAINDKAAADYLYGYQVTVPGVKSTPDSHHFSEWRDTITAAGDGVKGESDVAYTVRTGGTVTAYWAPNEGKVKLASQGGTVDGAARDQQVYAVWGEPLRTVACDDAGADTSAPLKAPTRTGYEFAGFWNHPYSENTAADGEFSGKIACYYEADGTTGNLKAADGIDAWNLIGDDITLYAHWRYKVVLDLNVYNSDGDIVLDGSGYAAGTQSDFAPTTEQVQGIASQLMVPRSTATDKGTAQVSAYTFTVIDGAPIQLPKATGRTGYADTSRWTFAGSTLRAGNAISAADLPNGWAPSAYDGGNGASAVVLKADWSEDPDDPSTSVTSYNVTYAAGEGATSTTGGPAATTIKYDGKITDHPGKGGFAKTGYHFVGWRASTTGDALYTEGTGGNVYTHRATENVTFTAQWEPNVYTVKLHGAADGAADEQTVYMKYGVGWFADAACTVPATVNAPARTGYECAGFADSATATTPTFFTKTEDGKRIFDAASAVPSNTKYSDDDAATVRDMYPVWRADVTWSDPSATSGAFTAIEYAYAHNGADTQVNYRSQGTRAGYTPSGWQVRYGEGASATYLKTDGTTGALADGEVPQLFTSGIVPVAGTCTIEATWTPVTYTATFNLGTAKYPEETAADFAVMAGSGFAGTTQNTPTVSKAADGAFKAASEFNATASAATLARPYEGVGGTIVLPQFACTGYGFEGWTAPAGVTLTDNGDGTYSFDISSATPAVLNNLTFTAVWGSAPDSYSLTTTVLMRDGETGAYSTPDTLTDMFDGSLPDSYDVSGLGLVNLAAKPGYVFEGWKAYKKNDHSATMLRQNGVAVDNLDDAAAPVKQTGTTDKVSIAPGMTGDGNVVLVAYFTKTRYNVTLRMAGIDDATMKPADANWEKKTDEAGTVTYELKGGYTVDAATVGGIALPSFDRAGYAFGGWTGSSQTGATLSEDTLKLLLQKNYDHGSGLQDYVIDAVWTPESYVIAYRFDHMQAVDHPHDQGATGRYTFEGSATLGSSIQIKPPTVDPAYYDSFDGWVIEDENRELSLGHGFTWSDAEKGWMLSADPATGTIEITRDTLRDFFPGNNANLTLRETHTARTYTATLQLNGGAMPSEFDTSRWVEQPDGSYQATYTCDDENIAIPEPWKYGCTFGGWTLTVDGADAEVDTAEFGEGDDAKTSAAILHDSIGERVYSVPLSDDPNLPGWAGAVGTIRFDANVPAGSTADNVPGGEVDVTFGKLMPVKSNSGAAFKVPVRAGYDFVGFFDTPSAAGGKQYYNASFAAACTWDKAVQYYQPGEDGFDEESANVKPHVLYARWTKSTPAGTPDENKPKPGEIVYVEPTVIDPVTGEPAVDDAKSSAVTVASQVSEDKPSICGTLALNAYFNGAYTKGADGIVEVRIDSTVWRDGLTARQVYDDFNAANGVDGKYLSGFAIPSTGDVIAFSDLAQGNAFTFTTKATEAAVELRDSGTVKTLAIAGEAVVALYSDIPYDFGKGPGGEPPIVNWEDLPVPSSGEVQAVFKGEGGTIDDGSGNQVVNLYKVTAYIKTESSPAYLVMQKPANPTRPGYDFAGWSLFPQADHSADDCTCTRGELRVTDILKKTYYAHWKEATYRVVFDQNHDGNTTSAVKNVVFGSTDELGTYVDDSFTERAGYLFMGYYDARTGGKQYFSSSGKAVRAWDRTDTNPATVLYAHWMIDPTSPDAPAIDPSPEVPSPAVPPSTDPVPVDPSDLFPPQKPSVLVPTDENSTVRMTTTVGLMALDGHYDGIYAETALGDAAIVMNSYAVDDVPASYDTAELSLRAMIARFEATPAANGQYLQGFRVMSTGSFVSVTDLYEGNAITITAKTDDLASVDGASVTFKNNRVEPVFGPTPAIPPVGAEVPGDWPLGPSDPNAEPPVVATQIHNVFDARGGLFANGLRFEMVPTGYDETIEVPKDDGKALVPVYHADETYHFDGWFLADGTRVTDRTGELVLTGTDRLQQAHVPTTYYARYVRTYYRFVLHDSNDGVDAAHAGSTAEVGEFRPYAGESLTQMASAESEFAGQLPPARDGYDFVGYFYTDEEGVEHPLYLSTKNGAKEHANYADFEAQHSDDERHASGWGLIPGIAGTDVDKDYTPEAIDLYAKWNPITYKVQWAYNWAGRDYVHKENGVAAPNLEAAEKNAVSIPFGTKVGEGTDEMTVPVIHDPAHPFEGWYTGTEAADDDFAVRLPVEYSQSDMSDTQDAAYADAAARGWFVKRGDAWFFEPHGIENLADKWPRTVTFFAAFDTDRNVSYKYRVYLGRTADEAAHGEFDKVEYKVDPENGIPYYEASYSPVWSQIEISTHFSYVKPKTGYTGPDWYASADSDDADKLALPVSIPQWTCGLQKFYLGWNAGSYSLEFSTATLKRAGEDGLSSPDGRIKLQGGTGTAFSSSDFGTTNVVLPEPVGAVGYRFAGWKRIDSNGEFVVGSNVYQGDLGAFDADFVTAYFGGQASGTLRFGAVWEPYAYRVNFHEYPQSASSSENPFESYVLTSEGGQLSDPNAAQDYWLALPYPHTTNVRKVFAFWSLYENDPGSSCTAWKSGADLTLRDILKAISADDALSVRTDEETGELVIDVYANWLPMDPISADVPLQVNILIDPWNPHDAMMGKVITSSVGTGEVAGAIANGWIASRGDEDIRIESLTFERGADELFELKSGADGGDAFTLKVYGGGKVADDETNALRLSLSEQSKSTVVLRDDRTDGEGQGSASQGGHIHGSRMYLDQFGMGGSIAKGEKLYLYYDLELAPTLADLSEYSYLIDPTKLLDASEKGENGESTGKHLSVPLAKLYYTIGLA